MQYIKIGPLKIPYVVKVENNKKIFQVYGLKIPFSTYVDGMKKTYKICGISFKLPNKDKYVITRRQYNYEMRDQLSDEKKKEIATEIFKEKVGYTPDFENPRSMNEKIFWFKFNYHNPMITKCCDKYAVKDYVTEKIGSEHIVPTIKSWDSPEDIDFNELPEQYVLKVNWSSGYNIIVKDASAIDKKEAVETLKSWMQPEKNGYYHAFNWGYKNMKPVVYAEKYIEQIDGQVYDYKFFCCNGEVKFWLIATNRFEDNALTDDYFDMDFNRLDLQRGVRATAKETLKKPRFYNEMIHAAEILSKEFPFVRVDFYETDDQFFVGEMTFYPGGGLLACTPVEWDYKLGEYIELPKLE